VSKRHSRDKRRLDEGTGLDRANPDRDSLERAALVVYRKEHEDSRDELTRLLSALGIPVAETVTMRLDKPNAGLLVGSGKAREIAERARELEIGFIVFDEDLSAAQERNWEQLAQRGILDRHEVILRIFEMHANTREARLQVELARSEHMLPRLRRAWTHLSRQRGGAKGTRGEGEKQLEADRRSVQDRIVQIKQELRDVGDQRELRRKRRRELPIPMGALVGYTNAGKSSLLRALTGADVTIDDQPFVTLDPTTRRLEISAGLEVVLSDTVGFIQRLPHQLIDAFHSTLEEALTSDFLMLVVDGSSPHARRHVDTSREVLAEIGAVDRPMLLVYNKVDEATDRTAVELEAQALGRELDAPALVVSAETGDGLDALRQAVEQMVSRRQQAGEYLLPYSRTDLAALVHRTGVVLDEQYAAEGIRISAYVPSRTHGLLAPFVA
jgi:GTP-binding protein HflX